MSIALRLLNTLILLAIMGAVSIASGQQLRLIERKPDPHGSPRPFRDSKFAPLRTSIYFELANAEKTQSVDPNHLSVELTDGEKVVTLLSPGRKFAAPASGWVQTRQALAGAELKPVDQVIGYLETGVDLRPSTTYTVLVAGDDANRNRAVKWSFTTEAAAEVRTVPATIDFAQPPIEWQGRFFSGLCNVVFCTPDQQFGPTYALMDKAREQHPRAWSYQRDFWMTGFEYRPAGLLQQRLPNIVRERETRRITAIDPHELGSLLKVEDFFGHEQYGIAADRPLKDDYHPGDEVLIADGISHAKVKVLATDDEARTVLVSKVELPKGGWKIEYELPLPKEENADAPGLFPPGGCYLRKFAPHGTACFYWGRLDKEWDLLHRKHGRRLFVNFADAPGDLSIDGRSWTTAKDYAQWHDVAKQMAGHVIDRYGDEALTFTWSVFNEPDLGPIFWRTSWDELQRYYDYTTDGILRAFEDRGYDSDKVFVGGLELGGIFGTNLRLEEFLAHCSPTATAKGALLENAAFADKRLDGKRSKRVEQLCAAHEGQGSPCDFVSIHAYNSSAVMAAKLVWAKELALKIDADYFAKLWVNSHEACPEWNMPPDQAAADSYLGNGYFPTWCVDVAARQLDQAAKDSRYAFGETLLTVWPPPADLAGVNGITRILNCDDDGDGLADRTVTIPYPAFHATNLLSDMGDSYWSLPRRDVAGHVVGGFASRDPDGAIRIALVAHQADDTQSRSQAEFDIDLTLANLRVSKDASFEVSEYRFDTDHNSYFTKAVEMRRQQALGKPTGADVDEIAKQLSSADAKTQLAALKNLDRLSPVTKFAVIGTVAKLAESSADQQVRNAAKMFIEQVFLGAGSAKPGLARADVEELERLSRLKVTRTTQISSTGESEVALRPHLSGNGLNMLVIKPLKADR
jgi:hypothetical protein